MRKLLFFLGALLSVVSLQATHSGSILESFTVTTENVTVREFTESALHLKTNSKNYMVKLEPNETGTVMFSLTDIVYTSTARFSNLAFGVKITGYQGSEIIYPIISTDDVNDRVMIEQNVVKFQDINGMIPVMFDIRVDSINLEFFNSIDIDVHQMLGIMDLKIVPHQKAITNPLLTSCETGKVMIGIDGSSSIDKKERGVIGRQMLHLVKESGYAQDSSTLCIMEFGTEVHSYTESQDPKTLYKAIKNYKRGRNYKRNNTSWTNWNAAFDKAIESNPEIFIFITDGWSNWDSEGPASFSSQYEELIRKSNTLKENGTRLLFITCGLEYHGASRSNLYPFLNGLVTRELYGMELHPETQLHEIDLVSLTEFASLDAINLASVYECPEEFALEIEEGFIQSE